MDDAAGVDKSSDAGGTVGGEIGRLALSAQVHSMKTRHDGRHNAFNAKY